MFRAFNCFKLCSKSRYIRLYSCKFENQFGRGEHEQVQLNYQQTKSSKNFENSKQLGSFVIEIKIVFAFFIWLNFWRMTVSDHLVFYLTSNIILSNHSINNTSTNLIKNSVDSSHAPSPDKTLQCFFFKMNLQISFFVFLS